MKGCFDRPQFVILVAVQLQHPNQALVPHTDCPLTGAPAEDKAAPRRAALCPIAINLGSGGCLQSGEGFVTPGHPGALAQGNYKTPPSGEWALFNSAASADRARQVLQFEAFGTLEMAICCHP